jgi:3-dehydroquinate synthetase
MSMIGGAVSCGMVMAMTYAEIMHYIKSVYGDEIQSLKMQILAIQIELNIDKINKE